MSYFNYCNYFRAKVERSGTLLFTATLRSCDHLAFDRTFDVENGIFEFFVPEGQTEDFILLMGNFEKVGIVSDFIKMSNRLESEDLNPKN